MREVGPGGTRKLEGNSPPNPRNKAAPPSSDDELTGQSLAGRYLLGQRIGRGGMGVVYRARHAELDRDVAVKLLRPELLRVEGAVARFRREARAVAQIESPHVVKVYDHGISSDRAFIVMEHLDGRSLRDLVASGAVEPARAIELACQILAALDEAHGRGIIHRDLKPENIYLESGPRPGVGPPEQVKLLDFGLSKIMGPVSWTDTGGLTASGVLIGTPSYMAPEQIRGTDEVGARSDLYSVGVVMYEMLTGVRPFVAASTLAVLMMHDRQAPIPPRKRRPELAISADLEAIVLRAMSKKPNDRFESARAMQQALGELGSPNAVRGRRGRRLALAATGVGLALALAIALLLASARSKSTPDRQREAREAGGLPWSAGRARADTPGALDLGRHDQRSTGQVADGPRPTADMAATVTITILPGVPRARVVIDGRVVGVGLTRLVLPVSDRPVKLDVHADGHRPFSGAVLPDRDRSVTVRLEPIRIAPRPGLGLEKNPYGRPK